MTLNSFIGFIGFNGWHLMVLHNTYNKVPIMNLFCVWQIPLIMRMIWNSKVEDWTEFLEKYMKNLETLITV